MSVRKALANPWLKKNPVMSMWLSTANRMAAPVLGQLARKANRQALSVADDIADKTISLQADLLQPPTAKKKAARKR